MKSFLNVTLVAVLILVASLDAIGQGVPQSANISLTRFNQANGDIRYEVRTTGFGSSFNGATGPSGRVFGNGPPLTNLTEAQMLSEIVGNWSLTGTPPGFPPAPQTYQFTIAPFMAADIFVAKPTIINPIDGAVVPRDFVVEWDWPDDVTPPTGQSARVSGFNSLTTVQFGAFVDNSVPISIHFNSGLTQTGLQVRGGSFEILDRFVSPVTSTSPTPYWSFRVRLQHENQSPAVGLTVLNVPEPAGAVLVVMGLLLGVRFRVSGVRWEKRREGDCKMQIVNCKFQIENEGL
jgi:hypothetical protein